MAEETVTVGDTEVTIEETDDGFEVTEASPEPGSVEKLIEDTGYSEGYSICVGEIDSIEKRHDGVRIYVGNDTYDVLGPNFYETIRESSWEVVKTEFDIGYVLVEDTDE